MAGFQGLVPLLSFLHSSQNLSTPPEASVELFCYCPIKLGGRSEVMFPWTLRKWQGGLFIFSGFTVFIIGSRVWIRSWAEQDGRLQRHPMISSCKGKHWPQPWQEGKKGRVSRWGNCWKSIYYLIFTRWGRTPSQVVNRVGSKRQSLVTARKGLCREDQGCFLLSGDCSCFSQSHLRCFKLWKHFGVSKWVPCNHWR